VLLYGPNYTARVGMGYTDEGPRLGFLLTTALRGAQWDIGDQPIPFQLPTDMVTSSYSFFGRGVGITRKGANSRLFVFVGGTSQYFSTPFVSSAQVDRAAAAVFWEHRLTSSLRFTSHNILSNTQTSIQALEWRPQEDLTLALAGGIGNSRPYWATGVQWDHDWLSVDAGYTRASRNFRRVRVRSPMLTESDGAAVRVDVRPRRWLGFHFQRQNYLIADADPAHDPHVAVTGAGTWARIGDVQVHGSWYRSHAAAGGADSMMVGGRRRFTSWLEAGADYLTSRPERGPAVHASIITVREVLSPRLSLTQVISLGNGRRTYSFGGNFTSNIATIGVEYQTVFSPAGLGELQFRQVLALTLRLQLPQNLQANVDTQVSPLGETRYSAYMTSFLYRGFGARPGSFPSGAIADYIIRGRVVDELGRPISGAAVMVGTEMAFADSQGQFFVRREKQKEYPLQVVLDQFMLPGKYEVVSAPSVARSAPEGREELVEIVLRRIPARRPTPAGAVASAPATR